MSFFVDAVLRESFPNGLVSSRSLEPFLPQEPLQTDKLPQQ